MSPRKSKRTSAVIKRKLLEKKLEQRKRRSLCRKNKSQSFKTLESEAAKDVSLDSETLGEEIEKSQSQSKESLVWDHSDETAPSFVTNSWESDQLEEALQNLYRSWDTSDKEQNHRIPKL